MDWPNLSVEPGGMYEHGKRTYRIIDFKGDFRIKDSCTYTAVLDRLIAKDTNIAYNLEGLSSLSSRSITVFLKYAKIAKEKQGHAIFLNPRPMIEETLTQLVIDEFIPIVHDRKHNS